MIRMLIKTCEPARRVAHLKRAAVANSGFRAKFASCDPADYFERHLQTNSPDERPLSPCVAVRGSLLSEGNSQEIFDDRNFHCYRSGIRNDGCFVLRDSSFTATTLQVEWRNRCFDEPTGWRATTGDRRLGRGISSFRFANREIGFANHSQ